jgi:hypothetical protein
MDIGIILDRTAGVLLRGALGLLRMDGSSLESRVESWCRRRRVFRVFQRRTGEPCGGVVWKSSIIKKLWMVKPRVQ